LLQFGPGFHLRQQSAWKHYGTGAGIETLDDAQAVGVAVSDEDTEGEGGLHR